MCRLVPRKIYKISNFLDRGLKHSLQCFQANPIWCNSLLEWYYYFRCFLTVINGVWNGNGKRCILQTLFRYWDRKTNRKSSTTLKFRLYKPCNDILWPLACVIIHDENLEWNQKEKINMRQLPYTETIYKISYFVDRGLKHSVQCFQASSVFYATLL